MNATVLDACIAVLTITPTLGALAQVQANYDELKVPEYELPRLITVP